MKIKAITLMAALAGVTAQAAENPAAPAALAQSLASGIFAGIGVKVEWRNGLDRCPAQGIMIGLSESAPSGRLEASWVMGHVLAHEIAHILEGIMKARWNMTISPA